MTHIEYTHTHHHLIPHLPRCTCSLGMESKFFTKDAMPYSRGLQPSPMDQIQTITYRYKQIFIEMQSCPLPYTSCTLLPRHASGME